MEFEIETGVAPTPRKGRQRTDLSPLLDAADAANGEWRSTLGTSSLHTYRTRIQSGETPGADVGEYEVKVEEETPAVGNVGDEDYESPTFRLFIRRADEETKARLVANYERRQARLAEGATDDEIDEEEENTPVNPLG